MKRALRPALGLAFGLAAAPAAADWLEFDMHAQENGGPGRAIGAVEAVDSWFTTLATLIFELEGLAPGDYAVVMLEQADCAGAAQGAVYRRETDAPAAPTGALGAYAVAADGTATRTLSIKPDQLNAAAEKLTVTEMRGHALALRGASGAVAACGAIPEGQETPER